jgi:hypothetical protein
MATNRLSPYTSSNLISFAERMERLRQDAIGVAFEHTAALLRTFEEAASLAEQVADGGEAYRVGVREIARSAYIDLAASGLNLRSIMERDLSAN